MGDALTRSARRPCSRGTAAAARSSVDVMTRIPAHKGTECVHAARGRSAVQRGKAMANKDPLRVGVLFSETGVTSTIGRSQIQGTLLAIDEINESGGVNGRELVAVQYDARSSPAVYADLAERLIVHDKLN